MSELKRSSGPRMDGTEIDSEKEKLDSDEQDQPQQSSTHSRSNYFRLSLTPSFHMGIFLSSRISLTLDAETQIVRLLELVNHLKESGDAKKGEGGQNRNFEGGQGPCKPGEGPSSTRETRSEQSQASQGKTSSEHSVTHVMSLFDLRDVCIVIGSLATLDLPMVVDLIGIYVLKGPYCTLTMTDWFFQALSVIPRGSWGDVARRFTMIRWDSPKL
ncbi:hypothetical protein F511_35689 [Dorcoceras hygrometricum]|uniref:Uncharacterized protein n=1 Tax=Dorcoceras hygrometricum TaxID=472368 RepID=A0A2Z7C728_9LAMI|nr:hypothetical protein F511_35689 [Dorcoceras hygrometricum]